MFWRSLTSRLVLAIVVLTGFAALVVAGSMSWLVYVVLQSPNPATEQAASLRTIALSAVLFSCVALTIATVIGWRLGRMITRPVLHMADAMMVMASGNLDVEPPRTHPDTEVGRMAYALEFFRTNARERLEAEAGRRIAETLAQERSEFLAVMSHEIRTPMNGVLGMADALAHSPLSENQQQMLSVLQDSGDLLLRLLNDILDFAKMESGNTILADEPFDLSGGVRTVADLFAPEANKKGLVLTTELPNEPLWVSGDAARLRQIVTNLVSNAVKFTRSGGVSIQLHAAAPIDGLRRVKISVTDTGIGIPENIAPKLFQKFFQADGSSTRIYGGTGLGLSISRELARMMGGDIAVQSVAGVGSTFTLELPMPIPAGDAVLEVSTGALVPNRPLRILIAEDNATNRQVLGLILEMISANVTFSFDGAEAVQTYAAADFDIVLMDLQMPVMTGLEAARSIRAFESATGRQPTPILAVTANARPRDVAACSEAGMDGHVAKPVDAAHLLKTITDTIAAGVGRREIPDMSGLRRAG